MSESTAKTSAKQPVGVHSPLPPDKALSWFPVLLAQVSELHRSGRLHGSIAAAGITADANGQPVLPAPAESVVLRGDVPEACPPELPSERSWNLPTNLEAARGLLTASGVEVDPRRIDVYQLGVLLCSVVSRQPASVYLRSPKARGLVPPALRPVIDRALGYDKETRIADCDQLTALVAQAANPPVSRHDDTPAQGVSQSPDTPPPAKTEARSSGSKPPTSRASASAIGLPFSRLGAYEIIDRIGGGGMGDVYKARDESLDRIVAIKVLPPELARQADFVRRFRAEAMAIAKLTHPNIVQVFAFGEDAGHHFFAMQFVEGESLAQVLRRRSRLPVDEALPIFQQCLAGLGAAHQRDLIHRDIKPGNILIDHEHRRALVADFGLVKTADSGDGLTATGVIMGTVDYISPEQARGQNVDGRSDLYSLGALMYQTLAGRLPFVSDSATGMIFQHAFEKPAELCGVAPEVPAQVGAIVMRLLAKNPAERYATAKEVSAAIQAFRAGKQVAGPAGSEAKPRVAAAAGVGVPAASGASVIGLPPLLAAPRAVNWADRLRDLWRAHAPAVIQGSENTQQQVDGAVAEYERRRNELSALARDAAAVAAEFASQAANHRKAAAAAALRAEKISDPNAAARAREEQAKSEQVADDFESQLAEQQEQSEAIQLRLTQVNATLQKLRSQRDVLQARLRAANARLAAEGALPPRPRRKIGLIAGGVGAGLLVVVAGFVLLRGKGERADVADAAKVTTLQPPPVDLAPSLARAPFDAIQAKAHQAAWARHLGTPVETVNSVGMKMVLIPPGEFLMGSADTQVAAALKVAESGNADASTKDRIEKAERPQHRVVITKPFWMGATEVTVGQFKKFVAATGYKTDMEAEAAKDAEKGKVAADKPGTIQNYLKPAYAVADDSPAAMMTWNDAVAYCKWLSLQEKATYRLPTEAEWEHACRAGTTTLFSFGDDATRFGEYGWSHENSIGKSHPVAMKQPNPFGLFDMHGNLYEWCQDGFDEKWYAKSPSNDPIAPVSGSFRVIRGGNWYYDASYGRSALRNTIAASTHYNSSGFRVMRVLDDQPASATPPPADAAKLATTLGDPAFQQWMQDVAALSAEKQWQAVSGKLMELNPGFDGKVTDSSAKWTPKIEQGMVTEFAFATDNVTDIAPVRALVGLKVLKANSGSVRKGKLTDLSPLAGMPELTYVAANDTNITDVGLKRMGSLPKLAVLELARTQITDASLEFVTQMPTLTQLILTGTAISDQGVKHLKQLPNLNHLGLDRTAITDKSLTYVRDLTKMKYLDLTKTAISDSGISSLKSLTGMLSVDLRQNKVTFSAVTALQEALPSTKIEWDGQTSPATPASTIEVDPLQRQVAELVLNKGAGSSLIILLGQQEKKPALLKDLPSDPFIVTGLNLTTSITADELATIARLKKLTMLAFRYPSPVTDDDLIHFDAPDSLTQFICQSQTVTDDGLAVLDKMPNLIKLAIVSPQVLGPGLVHLKSLSKLTDLEIPAPEIPPRCEPLKNLKLLTRLRCGGIQFTDASLDYIKDLPKLEILQLRNSTITNAGLETIGKMPALKDLELAYTKITDSGLEHLGRMKQLSRLDLSYTVVSDAGLEYLTPLSNLSFLSLSGTKITDHGLDHLKSMKLLATLHLRSTSTTKDAVAALRAALPTCKIEWDDPDQAKPPQPAAGAKAITTPGDPAFQAWMKDVATLSAEQQVGAVKNKLQELNPGFDGKVKPRIENSLVTGLEFSTDNVSDISPVRALAELGTLVCNGSSDLSNGKLSDLSPLRGMPLTNLNCERTGVSDLSPLQGMRLTSLNCRGTQVADLSHLKGMPLTYLNCQQTRVTDLSPLQGMSLTYLCIERTPAFDLSPVRGMPLKTLNCGNSKVSDLSPLSGMPLMELVCQNTAVSDLSPLKGMPLGVLDCGGTKVSDLSPLSGMGIKEVRCFSTQVSDLSPLEGCRSLKHINAKGLKITPTDIEGLQKSLPNCRIEWDGSA